MNEFAPALAIAIAAVLLSALVSGAVSAVANVRRMKRSGMLSAEEATIPGAGLVERARPVLIALSIALVPVKIAAMPMITLRNRPRIVNVSDRRSVWLARYSCSLWTLGCTRRSSS